MITLQLSLFAHRSLERDLAFGALSIRDIDLDQAI